MWSCTWRAGINILREDWVPTVHRNWTVPIPQVLSFHSHIISMRSNVIAPNLQMKNPTLNDDVTYFRYPGWWKAVLRFELRQLEMKSDLLNPMFSVPNCHRTISVCSLSVGVTQGRNTICLSTTLKLAWVRWAYALWKNAHRWEMVYFMLVHLT